MSLDVYLTVPGHKNEPKKGRIFIRWGGATREISRQTWDELNPGREPVTVDDPDDDPGGTSRSEVYTDNITHNLGRMAEEAGLYDCCWRPDEHGIAKAGQMVEPLEAGLATLKGDPDRFRQFNPTNGWGTYEGLVAFVENYLKACKEFPDADVSVWR